MVKKLLSGHSALFWQITVLIAACISARADSVVSLCNQDTQAGAGVNLEQALAAGGTVTFSCGGRATMAITKTHSITRDVAVNGSDVITFDAQGRRLSMFLLAANVNLTLANLTATGGRLVTANVLNTAQLGSVVATGLAHNSTVTLQSVEISANQSPILIANSDMKLTVRNSRFGQNTVQAIYSNGTANITEASFVGNETGISTSGVSETSLTSCTFTQNKVSAVKVGAFATLNVSYSQFQQNTGASGAALAINGRAAAVTLRSVDFTSNTATGFGGAVAITPWVRLADVGVPPANAVVVKMSYVTFQKNSGSFGGAIYADLSDGGTLSLGGALFDTNSATTRGGGLLSILGTVFVADGIFKSNTAADGSALYAIALTSFPLVLANTLVTGNSGPGAAIAGLKMDLINTTVAANQGAGIAARAIITTRTAPTLITVTNSILSRNASGNCVGALATFTFPGPNLQYAPASNCAGVKASDPMLDPMFAPLPGSPAYETADLKTCMASPVGGRDLYFQQRGVHGACSLGAIEFAPEQFMRWRAWQMSPQGGNQHPTR